MTGSGSALQAPGGDRLSPQPDAGELRG